MADNTIIQQGNFTSNGANHIVEVPSGIDWMRVFNRTAASQAAADLAYEFRWQRGYAAGTGDVFTIQGAQANDPITIGALAAPSGFYLYENSDQGSARLGSAVATTGFSNLVRPIVSTGTTTGLVTGSIVRLYGNANGNALNGLDVAIDTIVGSTSFRVAGALATAPGAEAAANAGFYRVINYDPLFYPPFRYIVNVTAAASAVVTVSVPSLYKRGQKVQFLVPALYGMTQLNLMTGTITAVTDTVATQTITVNIDTTAFSAFIHPTNATAINGMSRALVVPDGMDTGYAIAQSLDPLNGTVNNTGILGMLLPGGAGSPGGANADLMWWIAGKSFAVNNLI
jgi:hypothetical protein